MIHWNEGQRSETPFVLTGTDDERIDLTSRREVKYALPQMDVAKLRSLLDANCRRLVHNEPVSVVRSIYFDDHRLSACQANLDGLGRRNKLRIRWYDSLQPGTVFFAEVKWRNGHVTGKHRLHLRCDSPLIEWSYRDIRRQLEAIAPPNTITEVLRYTEPIVIVEYCREHFATDDGLRITLDYNLNYYDQTGKSFISTSFPRRLEGLVVLEGKTPFGREGELRRWLHPYSPRVGRCSKYVHGCVRIGLIDESEL